MAKRAKNPVKTSKKTIRILEALRNREGSRVTELADELEMNKSTVHNHLTTLEEEEFVVRKGTQYELGLRLLEFGGYVRSRRPLYQITAPEIERLARQTGELANLMVEEHGLGIYLDCKAGEQAVNLNIYPGMRRPLHITAMGKAILALLSQERVEEIIDQHGLPAKTEQSITNREVLYDQLQTIRDSGVAFDDEEYISGLRCVATPILDVDDSVLGAISISVPTTRVSTDRFRDEIPDTLRSAANVIELNIAHPQSFHT